MPRAAQFVGPAAKKPDAVIDSVMMTYEQRRMKHGFVFGAKGTCVELDFAQAPQLNTDDALVLDDGSLVEVVAETEPVLEARIADPLALARACWLLGDSHVPAQILTNRIRVRRSAANEALLAPLAAKITMVDAPFEPDREPDAHGHHDHGHDHHHGHAHDHHGHASHGHDDHSHDHAAHAHENHDHAHDHAHQTHGATDHS